MSLLEFGYIVVLFVSSLFPFASLTLSSLFSIDLIHVVSILFLPHGDHQIL